MTSRERNQEIKNAAEKMYAVRQGEKFVTTIGGQVELNTRGNAEITAMNFARTFGGNFEVVYMR
jgi:hypothetical protein